jgi:hypothetical protein
MADIVIVDEQSRRTITVPFTSTVDETDVNGNRFFTLVFSKVGIKFSDSEFYDFIKKLDDFKSEVFLLDFDDDEHY